MWKVCKKTKNTSKIMQKLSIIDDISIIVAR